MATTMVHVRVEENLKTQAAETLAAMGLSISDAVRVLLTRVVAEKQLPFEIKVLNVATQVAMAESDAIMKARAARFNSADDVFNAIEKETRQH